MENVLRGGVLRTKSKFIIGRLGLSGIHNPKTNENGQKRRGNHDPETFQVPPRAKAQWPVANGFGLVVEEGDQSKTLVDVGPANFRLKNAN